MSAYQTILMAVLTVLLFVTGTILAVDALEFEKFGACSDCVLLHKLKGWEQ